MTAGILKGALLEYIVRNLLKNCGFTNVKVDGIYTYENHGLFYVNGKGAAHDADVIMNPPVQMPFNYPTQLIFECKAYEKDISLAIVRNAAGLRNDLNEFEIVTKDSILLRQNNRRAEYAIEMRNRYNYQVGVASINEFTKPAVEFSANNKIPLLSLKWFLGRDTIRIINSISKDDIESHSVEKISRLYQFLKNRNGDLRNDIYRDVNSFVDLEFVKIGDIFARFHHVQNWFHIGLLETGDMVFLYNRNHEQNYIFDGNTHSAIFHWREQSPNLWELSIDQNNIKYDFYLPERIYEHWKSFSFDKEKALDMKQEFFSRIFVFNRSGNEGMPFTILNIDEYWLRRAKEDLI